MAPNNRPKGILEVNIGAVILPYKRLLYMRLNLYQTYITNMSYKSTLNSGFEPRRFDKGRKSHTLEEDENSGRGDVNSGKRGI